FSLTDAATPEPYALSLHDALPICAPAQTSEPRPLRHAARETHDAAGVLEAPRAVRGGRRPARRAPAYAAPQLRHASARARSGSACRAGNARARGYRHHADLHAPRSRAAQAHPDQASPRIGSPLRRPTDTR